MHPVPWSRGLGDIPTSLFHRTSEQIPFVNYRRTDSIPHDTRTMSPSDAAIQFSRACDRCCQKKVKVSGSYSRDFWARSPPYTSFKCDSDGGSCTGCRRRAQSCTFLIPPGKRGPKGKPRPYVSSVDHHPPVPSPQTPISPSAGGLHTIFPLPRVPRRSTTPLEKWEIISRAMAEAAPSKSLASVLQVCTDLFFDYLCVFTPVIDERVFRHALGRVLAGVSSGADIVKSEFTLVTTVCAKVCFFLPSDMIPEGKFLADPLLDASRTCLQTYCDADLENPTAYSIIIRYLHSNCLHTSARLWVSWQLFGDAIRLVQQMRLYDERTYSSLPAVQAEACRRAFWLVYIGDKSLSVLRRMPISVPDYSFEEGITTEFPSDENNKFRKTWLVLGYIF